MEPNSNIVRQILLCVKDVPFRSIIGLGDLDYLISEGFDKRTIIGNVDFMIKNGLVIGEAPCMLDEDDDYFLIHEITSKGRKFLKDTYNNVS